MGKKLRKAAKNNNASAIADLAKETNWNGWNSAIKRSINNDSPEALRALIDQYPDWKLKAKEHLEEAIKIEPGDDSKDWKPTTTITEDGNLAHETVIDVIRKKQGLSENERVKIAHQIASASLTTHKRYLALNSLFYDTDKRKEVFETLINDTVYWKDSDTGRKQYVEFCYRVNSTMTAVNWLHGHDYNVTAPPVREAVIATADQAEIDRYFERFSSMLEDDALVEAAQHDRYEWLGNKLSSGYSGSGELLKVLMLAGKSGLTKKVLNDINPQKENIDYIEAVLEKKPSNNDRPFEGNHRFHSNKPYNDNLNNSILAILQAGASVGKKSGKLYQYAVQEDLIGVVRFLYKNNYKPPNDKEIKDTLLYLIGPEVTDNV